MCSHVQVSPVRCTDSPFSFSLCTKSLSEIWPSHTPPTPLPHPQVNEQLRDILVEEQKLREASQESNATTQKVRTTHKKADYCLNMVEYWFKYLLLPAASTQGTCRPRMTCLHIQQGTHVTANQMNRWAQSVTSCRAMLAGVITLLLEETKKCAGWRKRGERVTDRDCVLILQAS